MRVAYKECAGAKVLLHLYSLHVTTLPTVRSSGSVFRNALTIKVTYKEYKQTHTHTHIYIYIYKYKYRLTYILT